MAPPTGLEPVTSWLTVMRSTDWAMEEYSAKHPIRCFACVGISLSFQAVTSQVFSAPLSLTSVFGMGTGGPSASSTPTILLYLFFPYLRSLYHLHGDSCGNRTRVAGVRGRSLNRLTNGPYNAELQHIKKNRSEQKYICPLREIWCTIGDSNPGPTD